MQSRFHMPARATLLKHKPCHCPTQDSVDVFCPQQWELGPLYGLAGPAHPVPHPHPLPLHAPASSCTALSDETSPDGLGRAVSSLHGIAGCPPSAGCHPYCQHLLYVDNHLLCEDIPEFPSAELSSFISHRNSLGEGKWPAQITNEQWHRSSISVC